MTARPRTAPSRRPYLLRAMHEWISDSGCTPHVIVDARGPQLQVPSEYVKDGKIVLNVSLTATQRLLLGNEWIEFDARFGGRVCHVRVPVGAVLGIYARETGEGMLFSELDPEPQPPAGPDDAGPDGPDKGPGTGDTAAGPPGARGRARLTVVK